MKKTYLFLTIILLLGNISIGQDYGNYPKIEKQKLLNDLELLYQGLDKFHSGMYWYTQKKSVDSAFAKVKSEINKKMNVLEFNKLIAPLVSLSREGHTSIRLADTTKSIMKSEGTFFPFKVVFLGENLYCYSNGSNSEDSLIGLEIESINGEKPLKIAEKLASFYSSDGYIKSVKRYYLSYFNFSKTYYRYYGKVNSFRVKFKTKEKPLIIEALSIEEINKNLIKRKTKNTIPPKKELFEYKVLNDSTAYLGVHSFSNDDIKDMYGKLSLKIFLENSFQSISEKNIQNLIIDVSKNGGGTEGNGSLLYSYLGDNFKKYNEVRVNTNKGSLDNKVNEPITFKVFGPFERIFFNKKMPDGSFLRKQWPGKGLMAFKKEPDNKFKGKTYVMIGPRTYSGGSEFSNLVYTQNLATFVGQETGGGYYGNTSGYSQKLVLPNSGIIVTIPTLQFVMNVNPTLPFGSGVIPQYEVIPTIEEFLNKEDVVLEFILHKIAEKD